MKLIILDRDGVINEDLFNYVDKLSKLKLIDNSIKAIAALYQNGWTLAIATNQAGISKNLYSDNDLSEIHQAIRNAVKQYGGEIGFIAYCPHIKEQNCSCRKPKIGLLEQIAKHYQIALNQEIYFVGDSISDLQAAQQANLKPVLVLTGKGYKTKQMQIPSNTLIYQDLFEFANILINGALDRT